MARMPDALVLTATPVPDVSEADAATVLARATEILLRIDRRVRWGSAATAPEDTKVVEENRAA